MGDFGASYIRFSYALPFAGLWLWIWMQSTGQPLPQTTSSFWIWVSVGGVMQVIFTVLLITLFNHRNFAAGTAFSKTEVLQAAIFEALIIGEIVSVQVGLAIAIGVLAILMLSFHKSSAGLSGLWSSLSSTQSLLGLAAGAFLGLSTVSFRAATESAGDRRYRSAGIYVCSHINLPANLSYGRPDGPYGQTRADSVVHTLAFCLAGWPVRGYHNSLLVYRIFA